MGPIFVDSWSNKHPIGRFPSKHCVTTFQNNLFLTCQRLNIWLFSYHFAWLSVFWKWLLCQPTLFTKNPPNTGNILGRDNAICGLSWPGIETWSFVWQLLFLSKVDHIVKMVPFSQLRPLILWTICPPPPPDLKVLTRTLTYLQRRGRWGFIINNWPQKVQ